jgi:DNA-binding NtrC family response regulator
MSGSRFTLVADDQRLASSVLTHLRRSLPQLTIAQYSYDDIRAHLVRDPDGPLGLMAATAVEAEQAVRLIQEIAIRKLPPKVVLVEMEQATGGEILDGLKPHLADRIRWPEHADQVATFARDHQNAGHAFNNEATIEAVITRSLLAMTPSLAPLADRIALAAVHDVTVLITGETGTGKTFLARLLHDCSPRKQHPFLAVPCGALPPNLLESAFFGHSKGAFTGADRAKIGKFEAAGQGTILLDEIDTLGLEQQAALLRVIETGEYEPVGSNETRRCQARIIVASNWDLEEAVETGRFRRDLYYRLNVMSFHLPPLRERVQDIAPLVRGMASRYNAKFRKDLYDISPEAMAAIETHPWPGNIRQLENALQQAVLLSNGSVLLPEHLPTAIRDYVPVVAPAATAAAPASLDARTSNGTPEPTDSLLHNRELLERNVIQRALANNGYSRARAAQALGISRVTLYKKMKKYDLMNSPARSSRPIN